MTMKPKNYVFYEKIWLNIFNISKLNITEY